MKVEIELVVSGAVVLFDRLVHVVDDAPHARDFFLAPARGGKPPGMAEETGPDFICQYGLIEIHLPDEHAAVRNEFDKPGLDKGSESFANRTAADLELLGEMVLVEPFAHGHGALENHLFDLGAKRHRQRTHPERLPVRSGEVALIERFHDVSLALGL
jgi:hypothetical protein